MKSIYNLFFATLISFSAIAAPGDDCSTSVLVSANGCSALGAFNNTAIVGTLAPPVCFGAGANNGFWFKFIAAGPSVNITVNGGTLASPMIGLFSSTGVCVSPFTELGCTNPGGITATLPYSALIAGNTYYIYVDGANNNVGTFQLCLTSPSQPSNDNPCNAITLPTSNFCSGPNAYTIIGATGENLTSVSIPACFDNPGVWNSVYFTFVATGSTVDIRINGSIVRPQVALIALTGLCSGTTFNNMGCSQAAAGNTTSLTVANAVAGTTYYIVVDGFSSNTGAFEICLNNYTPTGTVINDACINATVLCPNNRYFSSTVGATAAGGPDINLWSCNGVIDNSVWFRFTTTSPVQPINFAINGVCTGGSLQFEVFRKTGAGAPCATTSGWTGQGCTNAISPSGSTNLNIPAAGLSANTDYYIVVDNFPSENCNFDFTITGNQGANAAADQAVCFNAAPFTLPGFTPTGGIWSGPGVNAAGLFNPANAGIGSHLLFYTVGPCTDTKIINVTAPIVNVSNGVSICPGNCTTLLGDATERLVNISTPSFNNLTDFPIPDNNTAGVNSPINTSGLNPGATVSSICFNIAHTFVGDLRASLICPSGNTLSLTSNNGGGGDNYTNTCFNLTSAVNITSGAPPYSAAGGYAPQGGSLVSLNSCLMNGNWRLNVSDNGFFVSGTLLDWTITFNNPSTSIIPATSFTWAPTTAMTGNATLSPTVCPVATTVYSLTATDINGCRATDFLTITISPLTITVSPTQNICAGASTTLTAIGASSYIWSPATGLSSTSGSAVVANPVVTTTYIVTGSQSGCTDTKTVIVTVGSLSISANSATICAGSTATLIATGATNYTWSPAATLSSPTGSLVTANPVITTIYTILGAVGACTGTTSANVTISSNLSLTSNNATVCPGFSATLTANGAASYTWSPAGSLNTSNGSVVVATPATSTTYNIIGLNGSCTGSTTVNVTVSSTPTIVVNSATVCPSSVATLIATGATSYTWFPSATLSASSGSLVTSNPIVPTTYIVTGILNGCINTNTTIVSIFPNPTVTVNSATVCAGSTATLIATGATTYTWANAADLSSSTGSLVTANPTTTSTYTVIGSLNGCINSNTTIVTVNAIPVVLLSPNITVCPLSINNLTASGATNFTWTPNVFLNVNTGANVITTPSITITYTVNAINATCSGSAQVTVIVTNTVIITPSTNTVICQLGSANISASGATSYTWFPAASLNSPVGGVVTATPGSTTTYTVIGSTSTCTNLATVTVSVAPTPTLTVNSGTICSGTAIPLTVSGAANYTWSPAAGLSNVFGSNVSASPNNTTIYTINGASSTGCLSTVTSTVEVVSTPTLIANASPSSMCIGETSILNVSGATNYTWNPGAINSDTAPVSPINTTTYTVIGSNSSGNFVCSSSTNVVVQIIPITVVQTFTANPICIGEQTTITASVTATGANIYTWLPTIGLTNPNSSSSLAGPIVTTIYTVTASNNGLCPSTATVLVIVNPLPNVNAGSDTTINIDESVVLNGFSNVPAGSFGFLSPNSTPLICNFCPIVEVNPKVNTCYTLKAENSFGCIATDDVCITIKKDWNVYIPNAFTPNDDANNGIFIPVGYGIDGIKLLIFDRWGVQIFKSDDTTFGWDGKFKGELCQEGVYIYQVEIKTMSGKTIKRTGHVTLLSKIK